jgi:hypothetical protein
MAAVHPEPWLRALITTNNNMTPHGITELERAKKHRTVIMYCSETCFTVREYRVL